MLGGLTYLWSAEPTPTVNRVCREQRSKTADSVPAEANRTNIIKVWRFNQARQYAKDFELKNDVADTKAQSEMSPTTPNIDQVIDVRMANLVLARSIVWHYFEQWAFLHMGHDYHIDDQPDEVENETGRAPVMPQKPPNSKRMGRARTTENTLKMLDFI